LLKQIFSLSGSEEAEEEDIKVEEFCFLSGGGNEDDVDEENEDDDEDEDDDDDDEELVFSFPCLTSFRDCESTEDNRTVWIEEVDAKRSFAFFFFFCLRFPVKLTEESSGMRFFTS